MKSQEKPTSISRLIEANLKSFTTISRDWKQQIIFVDFITVYIYLKMQIHNTS